MAQQPEYFSSAAYSDQSKPEKTAEALYSRMSAENTSAISPDLVFPWVADHSGISRIKRSAVPSFIPCSVKNLGLEASIISSRSMRFSSITGQALRISALYASSGACNSSHLQYFLTALGPRSARRLIVVEALGGGAITLESLAPIRDGNTLILMGCGISVF